MMANPSAAAPSFFLSKIRLSLTDYGKNTPFNFGTWDARQALGFMARRGTSAWWLNQWYSFNGTVQIDFAPVLGLSRLMAKIASSTIDWAGIRAAALSIGVREAARRAGADLPPEEQNRFVERVMKRAQREKWIATRDQMVNAPRTKAVASEKAMSANVQSGAKAVSDALADESRETKTSLSRTFARIAKTAEKGAKLKDARNLHEVAKGSALVHRWQQDGGEKNPTVTNLAFINVNLRGRSSAAPGAEKPAVEV